MVELVCIADHTSGGIQHALQLVSTHFWSAGQYSIAVVDA